MSTRRVAMITRSPSTTLRRLVIALLGAGRDRLARRLGRERHRDAVRRQGLRRRRRAIQGAAD
jgi:hypothetical protein